MVGPLITIQDVFCRIAPQLTLRVDRLTIKPGQHWCVFGANGSGTSLLTALISDRLIAGREGVHYAPDFNPQHDLIEVSFAEQQRLWEHDNRHDISEYDPSALDTGTTVRALVCGDDESSCRQPAFDLELFIWPTVASAICLPGRCVAPCWHALCTAIPVCWCSIIH